MCDQKTTSITYVSSVLPSKGPILLPSVHKVLDWYIRVHQSFRSDFCLKLQGGVVMVTEDVGEKLMPKFAKKAEDMQVNISVVPNGSIEQLKELVALVARGEVRHHVKGRYSYIPRQPNIELSSIRNSRRSEPWCRCLLNYYSQWISAVWMGFEVTLQSKFLILLMGWAPEYKTALGTYSWDRPSPPLIFCLIRYEQVKLIHFQVESLTCINHWVPIEGRHLPLVSCRVSRVAIVILAFHNDLEAWLF